MYIYILKFSMIFENKIKWMNGWMNEWNFDEHKKCKNDAELIYEKTAETVKVRSNRQWYKEDDKST